MSYTGADELTAYVRTQVAIGYYSVEDLVDEIAYTFGTDEAIVRPLVEGAAAAIARESTRWPDVTDCNRLDAAFAALDARGIRARQHFACCNTCAHTEMVEDIHDARFFGATIDGYVFYHRQDADAVLADGVLHLRYATIGGDAESTRAIGHRVVEALRAEGFAPIWDGSAATTIQLRGFRWQRNRWPDEDVTPPFDALATWCTRFVDTARSDFVAALGEPFTAALVARGQVDLARAIAAAPVTSALAPTPRARALGTLAMLTGDATLWHDAFACIPYGPHGMVVDLLLDVDLTDEALRAVVYRRVTEMKDDVHGAAALAWYLALTQQRDEHQIGIVRRVLDGPDQSGFADSARLAIRAALAMLGDTAMRAHVIETMTGPDQTHLEEYACRAARRAVEELRPAPSTESPPTIAELEARLERMVAGYDEGLTTSHEIESARYELALRQGELATLAARYRDDQHDDRAELRAHVEAVRYGAPPRVYVPVVSWLEPRREHRLAGLVEKWVATTTPAERRRERRSAERALEAAAAIATVDHDRARALIAQILDGETTMLDPYAVIVAHLAVDDLDSALAVADRSWPGCAAIGALATRLGLDGRTDEALAWLARTPLYLYTTSNVLPLATAVLAVAADRRAAAVAMLDAWTRADAALDALVPR